MVRRALRSRSLRRVKVKTPGGNTVTHYRKKKPKAAHCAGCGDELKGVPKERPHKMQNMAKTKKRPERKFGGVLCSKCSKQLFKQQAKSLE